MNTLLTTTKKWFVVQFWASPHDSMSGLFWLTEVRVDRALRELKALTPGFPRDVPPPEPPGKPARPFPTDVPAPEPHDVPAPEPRDVPPPDPGKVPEPAKPPERPKQDPQPRPIP